MSHSFTDSGFATDKCTLTQIATKRAGELIAIAYWFKQDLNELKTLDKREADELFGCTMIAMSKIFKEFIDG